MSDAFFCDRCGRAFPYVFKRQLISKGFKWGKGDHHVKDLCPGCVLELKEFLNENEDNNKGKPETGNDISSSENDD